MNKTLKAAGVLLVATTLLMAMPAVAHDDNCGDGQTADPFDHCGNDRDIAVKCWYYSGESDRVDYSDEASATIMIAGEATKYLRATAVTNLAGDLMNAPAPSALGLWEESNGMDGLQHMAGECQNYLWLDGCGFWMKMPWGVTEADLNGMTDMQLMELGMEGDVSPLVFLSDDNLL
ncbi:MAG: hypothetical protein ACPGQL_08070 [Thermoplasmatota archaeon]